MFPRKILRGIGENRGCWGAPGSFGLSGWAQVTLKSRLRCEIGLSEKLNIIFYRVPAPVYVGRVCQEVFVAR